MDKLTESEFKILNSNEAELIHTATLEVLYEVGIKVESEQAVEIFYSAGAKIEKKKNYHIVKIPSFIIDDCMRCAPRTVIYHGRELKDDYHAAPGQIGFSNFSGCVQIIDPETRKVKPSGKKDLETATLVCDYLDEIAVAARSMYATDCGYQSQTLHNYEAMVKNTSKHICIGFEKGANVRKIVDMAISCVGGKDNFTQRPIVSASVCPTSPLTLTQQCCQVIMECARSGIGIVIDPMALSGATSCVTLAGTLITHNAEVMSALTLAQLTTKGTACTYAGCSTIMDLRFGFPSIGSPELAIISCGLTKLAQYYQLPSFVCGGASDSKVPDAQAAYESSLSATLSALSGANIVCGAGCLEMGLTFDLAKLIMDVEQIQRINKILCGIDFTKAKMNLDVIKEVGPGGEFITHNHTFNNMRSMSKSNLFDRRDRAAWIEHTKGKDLTERAYEEARNIVKTHKPIALPKGASETMKSIIEDSEAENDQTGEKNEVHQT